MKRETKRVIYLLFDLLDQLHEWSQEGSQLMHIDSRELQRVKKDLFKMMSTNKEKQTMHQLSNREAFLIFLITFLNDKKELPQKKDVIKFAKKLGMTLSSRKSRMDLIGTIITEIAKKDEKEVTELVKRLNNQSGKVNDSKVRETGNFIDAWIDFYEHYKE